MYYVSGREITIAMYLHYASGENIIQYIGSIWENQKFILRQGGDVASPIIFNIIIDAVLRKWKSEEKYGGSRTMFYADDGLIENNNSKFLQRDLTKTIKLFEHLGLKTNEYKTKFMVTGSTKGSLMGGVQSHEDGRGKILR